MLSHRCHRFSRSLLSSVRSMASSTEAEKVPTLKPPPKTNSLAMKYYMERKKAHDQFVAHERSQFELGKKHLANMMGMSAEAMTQEDIDKAIDYLFPSGLYEPKARPVMKPPEEIFARQKDKEFDDEGRPNHPFFYCVRPNFVQVMYDLRENLNNVTFLGERMLKQNRYPDPDQVLSEAILSTTRWITVEEINALLVEDVKELEYEEFINTLERLLENPFAYKAKDFIDTYRRPVASTGSMHDIEFVEPEFAADGRAFIEAFGQRKSSVAKVRVTKPGTGKFAITHVDYMDVPCDITYFHKFSDRHQCLYPLQFTRLLDLVDVECIVDAGGSTGQAGAIRYALSLCLKSFVDAKTVEEMKVCGLLTQDVRVRERKKPGQEGARRKYTWKKR